MEYYEVFTSEEFDNRVLRLNYELTSFFQTELKQLLDELSHQAYEAGKRDSKKPEQLHLPF